MPPEFGEAPLQEAKVTVRPKDLLLAFSGSKDSLAAALLAGEAGYNVTLYHVAGVNPAFTKSELEHARCLAELLQMPLAFGELKLGKSTKFYTEHPIKNHLILAMMVQYGFRSGPLRMRWLMLQKIMQYPRPIRMLTCRTSWSCTKAWYPFTVNIYLRSNCTRSVGLRTEQSQPRTASLAMGR